MRHYYYSSFIALLVFPAEVIIKVLNNNAFIIGVERIGSLIKKYILRIFINGACNKNPLTLALADLQTIISDLCLKPQGQRHNKIVNVGNFTSFNKCYIIYRFTIKRNIL